MEVTEFKCLGIVLCKCERKEKRLGGEEVRESTERETGNR